MQWPKLTLSDQVSIVAAVIALTSLAVSVRSCQQTDRAMALAEREFEEARTFFWTGAVEKLQLHLMPSNPDVKPQAVEIVLPKVFDPFPSTVDDRKLTYSLEKTQHKLKELWEASVVYEGDNVFASATPPPRVIPLVVECRYVVKGQVRQDRSLYYLTFDVTMLMSPKTTPHVSLQSVEYSGLRFIRRVPDDMTAEAEVEAAWAQHVTELNQPAA